MNLKKINIGSALKYVGRAFRKMGQQTVYSVMLMVYAYRSDRVPAWAKRIIIGTLGYVLAPIDAVPDLSPIVGYTDDLGVLTFGLVTIAAYINTDVREKARNRVESLFGEVDAESLRQVDAHL